MDQPATAAVRPGEGSGSPDGLTGRLLDGRYEVRQLVARGGMATVYTALDRRLDRVVAVKIMHAAFAEDAEFVARFHDEAKAAARVSHPNVVAVTDQGIDGRLVFLVMEYVHGRTLRQALASLGRLSPDQALTVSEPVAAALAAAHDAGLVHRDVKPENVLLADDGRVKVTDFGLARAVAASSRTAAAGLLIGTVAYVAPEQVSGHPADTRTDVYAAGVMLYEMLTGEPPYRGDTPLAVAYAHLHSDVPAPSATPGVAATLDALVHRCTRRDPAERPADGRAFLREVQAARVALTAGSGPHHTAVIPIGESPTQVVRTAPVPPPPASPAAAARPAPAAPAGTRRDTAALPLGAHRRRRGVALGLALGLVTLLVALAAWWFGAGRYTRTPDLVGLSPAAATAAAHHDSLKVVTDTPAYSETVPVGEVASQSPGPNHRVTHGTVVHLHLSLGQDRVVMPDVVGQAQGAAEHTVTSDRLAVGTETLQYDDAAPSGQVLAEDPPPGTRVKPGSRIALTISKGPTPVTLPDETGATQADATRILRAAGVAVSITQVFSETVVSGTVVSQTPGGGQVVGKGSTVTLSVSKGPELVTVPDVRGMSVQSATAELTGLGFKTDVHTFPGGPGTVLTQSPGPGTQERKSANATITLFVF